MRKTCCSANTSCTSALSARALARSVPNGFSMTTRASRARSASPSSRTVAPAAAGGTLR